MIYHKRTNWLNIELQIHGEAIERENSFNCFRYTYWKTAKM